MANEPEEVDVGPQPPSPPREAKRPKDNISVDNHKQNIIKCIQQGRYEKAIKAMTGFAPGRNAIRRFIWKCCNEEAEKCNIQDLMGSVTPKQMEEFSMDSAHEATIDQMPILSAALLGGLNDELIR